MDSLGLRSLGLGATARLGPPAWLGTVAALVVGMGVSAPAPGLGQTALGQTALAQTALAQTALAQTSSEEQTGIRVYQIASPAVVTIGTGRATGSGSIVSPEGLVLTNEHVVRGSRTVNVTLADGRRYRAQVLSSDRRRDLALLQMVLPPELSQGRYSSELGAANRLPTLRFGSEAELAVGQRVYAIGSPFGLSGTLTTGILSRIDRGNGILQTDAAINPGNSGGPLLNAKGELIGVNTAILNPSRQGGNIGIGFASSASVAQTFVQTARLPGGATAQTPGAPLPSPANPLRLGVSLNGVNFTIQSVAANSLAAQIGLRAGDRIVGVNGERLVAVEQLSAALVPQTQLRLVIARQRRLAQVTVQL